MSENKFGVILLAAGKSARFGDNKLLSIIRDKKMIDHSLDIFLALPMIESIVVVIGGYREQMQDHLQDK